jgi:CRISPR-associated endonuclease/helicase Cas3
VQAGWAAAIEQAAAFVPEVTPAAPASLPAWLDGKDSGDPLVTDLLIRLVFSALVDTDFLDTEAHFRRAARPRGQLAAGDLADRYDRQRAAFLAGAARSPADGLWQEVYPQAVAAAAGPVGMYRLPAPTGSGKTLAAGGFALHHARVHQLRQVVVVVPFISITEQNADIPPAARPERGAAGGARAPQRSGPRRPGRRRGGPLVAQARLGELGRAVHGDHYGAVVPVAV